MSIADVADASAPPKPPAPRLLDLLRQQIRAMHYSIRTEEAYVHWVQAFVRFHGLRHPSELSSVDVQAFLTWLAAERQVLTARLSGISDLDLVGVSDVGDAGTIPAAGRPEQQLATLALRLEMSAVYLRLAGG